MNPAEPLPMPENLVHAAEREGRRRPVGVGDAGPGDGGRDQLSVVYRYSIASRPHPVHASAEIPHPRANHELTTDRVAPGAGHLAGGPAAAAG
jgi:hypothetical protein